jgi:hypothetical protein
MTCGEYRHWFAILLGGGEAANWPEKEYHLHSLRCPACQMILSTNEAAEAITDVASMAACSVDELLVGEQALRQFRRKMTLRRMFRRTTAVLAATAVLILAVVLHSQERAQERALPTPPGVASLPATPEEFAGGPATGDFEFYSARQVRTSRELTFVFTRKNPGADQYEFTKRVALSGFEARFADAPKALISIQGPDGTSILRVNVYREELLRIGATVRDLPAPLFCRSFHVLNDTGGKALLPAEEQE